MNHLETPRCPLRLLALGACLALIAGACDSDSGTQGTTGDVTQDATASDTAGEDTTEAADTGAPPVDDAFVDPDTSDPGSDGDTTGATADTSEADTSSPVPDATADDTTTAHDTTQPSDTADPGVCLPENCPVAQSGPIGIAITYHPSNVQPPTLQGLASGSSSPSGLHDLVAVDIYPTNAISPLLTVNITDNYDPAAGRGTNGTVTFEPDLWMIFLGLDLRFQASGFGQNFDEQVEQDLEAGGCWTISGNTLQSDLSVCASSWPDDVEMPDSAEFAYDDATGQFRLKLVLTREFMMSFVPPEYASLAGIFITGDLVLVATATRNAD